MLLTAGSRKSLLAVTQTKFVIDLLTKLNKDLVINLSTMITKGDKTLDVSLSKIGGKGLFIKELEEALFAKKIDFAVHSLKDFPAECPEGLVIAAVLDRNHPFDALVSMNDIKLLDLPSGAIIGSSSLRRKSQLLSLRPDLQVLPIRGNIDTRLKKLHTENFDAIVLAAAGLYRLDLEDRISEVFSPEIFLPAVGQGALAIQCRADDIKTLSLLHQINDETTTKLVFSEKQFMSFFEGGCHLPIASYAYIKENKVYLEGLVGSEDGSKILRDYVIGDCDEKDLGKKLGLKLMLRGADKILAQLEE